MNAVGYVRVSTNKQDDSAEDQVARIKAQALVKGTTLIEVIQDIDEFSGNLNRPGVQRLLDMVKSKKVDAVIITKLDRLTRSTRDAIDLIELFSKKHVALISITESLDTDSPMGRFFVRMIASIAELEREMICSRTKDGMRYLKVGGFSTGKAPYGWMAKPRTAEEREGKIRHKLVEEKNEQAVIARAVALKEEGMTYVNIARILNGEGYRTRSGSKWVYQYVIGILRGAKNVKAA